MYSYSLLVLAFLFLILPSSIPFSANSSSRFSPTFLSFFFSFFLFPFVSRAFALPSFLLVRYRDITKFRFVSRFRFFLRRRSRSLSLSFLLALSILFFFCFLDFCSLVRTGDEAFYGFVLMGIQLPRRVAVNLTVHG